MWVLGVVIVLTYEAAEREKRELLEERERLAERANRATRE